MGDPMIGERMRIGAPTMRAVIPPAAAALALVGLAVLRFALPDASGLLLFATVPIALLGMMLGVRAGLLAALFASAVSLIWAGTVGHQATIEWVNHPLTFFVLGGISGYFAHGALGDYDLRRALTCSEIRRGLANHELRMDYQPIVRAGDGEAIGVEALARWRHPHRGEIEPMFFIPAAESDPDTIWQLTLETFKIAMGDLSELGNHGLIVAVNISPVSLQRSELPAAIDAILTQTGFPANRLAIEVTESAFADGDDAMTQVLAGIKALGAAMLAIDDFGVGHSSLARLGHLPFDTLKIDRAMVSELPDDSIRAVIGGIVELGHSAGMTVIAEGVEDERAADWLKELDCDAMQGFHFARPMPPDRLSAWLQGRREPSRA